MAKRFSVVPTRHGFLTEESQDGALVAYSDYAKLREALKECVHQIECVMDYYPIHPIDQPKLVYTLRQAREVLGE